MGWGTIYHGQGVDMPWVGGSNTMGTYYICYGQGVIQFQNFQKIKIFKNLKIPKLQNKKNNKNFNIFQKVAKNQKQNSKCSQNFKKYFNISKFVYDESDIFPKIGFAEISNINKGLLVY